MKKVLVLLAVVFGVGLLNISNSYGGSPPSAPQNLEAFEILEDEVELGQNGETDYCLRFADIVEEYMAARKYKFAARELIRQADCLLSDQGPRLEEARQIVSQVEETLARLENAEMKVLRLSFRTYLEGQVLTDEQVRAAASVFLKDARRKLAEIQAGIEECALHASAKR